MYFEAVFQPSNGTEYNSDAADFVGKKWPFMKAGPWKTGLTKDSNVFIFPTQRWAASPKVTCKSSKASPLFSGKKYIIRRASTRNKRYGVIMEF
jgi:hypothetical protein